MGTDSAHCLPWISGKLRGTLIDDERIVDPRGLAVDPKENLLFLNSGADRVLAISPQELIVRDTGRSKVSIPAAALSVRMADTTLARVSHAQSSLCRRVLTLTHSKYCRPRSYLFPEDLLSVTMAGCFSASGIGPNGEGDNSILAFAPGVSPAIRPTRFVSDPELSPLDLAIDPTAISLSPASIHSR